MQLEIARLACYSRSSRPSVYVLLHHAKETGLLALISIAALHTYFPPINDQRDKARATFVKAPKHVVRKFCHVCTRFATLKVDPFWRVVLISDIS